MKISVLVAAFNVEKYISECLDSLYKQSFKDAEFIVIDDGSTDSTGIICDAYCLKDSRFKVIHQENKGLLYSRKMAVSISTGEYIIFLDGDDFLEYSNALKDLYENAIINKADILRFDVVAVLPDGTLDNKRMEELFNKKGSNQVGSYNIIKQCFLDRLHHWNVWQFLYSGNVVRQAYYYAVDDHFIVAEDAYGFFLIAYFSNTYKKINTKPIYHYRIKDGITSSSSMSFSSFKEHAKQSLCVEWLRNFLIKQNELLRYNLILNNLEFCLFKWEFDALKSLDLRYRKDAFDYIASLPNSSLKFNYLYSNSYNFENKNLSKIKKVKFLKYLKYRILAKILFGSMRKYYKLKYKEQKEYYKNS